MKFKLFKVLIRFCNKFIWFFQVRNEGGRSSLLFISRLYLRTLCTTGLWMSKKYLFCIKRYVSIRHACPREWKKNPPIDQADDRYLRHRDSYEAFVVRQLNILHYRIVIYIMTFQRKALCCVVEKFLRFESFWIAFIRQYTNFHQNISKVTARRLNTRK